jgi:hypothetical protein
MILGRGVVGVGDGGVVFVERRVDEGKARKVALRAVGKFTGVVEVGKIIAFFVDDPVYQWGCSPSYGLDRRYETCRHCILDGDLCRTKRQVDMSDGGKADVTGIFRYEACESLICWLFARFLNRFGWVNDRCIEEWDNAMISRGNSGVFPDLVLFAGSEDSKLALFVRSALGAVEGRRLPNPPFRVKVQSVDYWSGSMPKIVNWETGINGTGLFLVWFGNYVLPFRAYYSYPAGVGVRPGFSGSNAYVVEKHL